MRVITILTLLVAGGAAIAGCVASSPTTGLSPEDLSTDSQRFTVVERHPAAIRAMLGTSSAGTKSWDSVACRVRRGLGGAVTGAVFGLAASPVPEPTDAACAVIAVPASFATTPAGGGAFYVVCDASKGAAFGAFTGAALGIASCSQKIQADAKRVWGEQRAGAVHPEITVLRSSIEIAEKHNGDRAGQGSMAPDCGYRASGDENASNYTHIVAGQQCYGEDDGKYCAGFETGAAARDPNATIYFCRCKSERWGSCADENNRDVFPDETPWGQPRWDNWGI